MVSYLPNIAAGTGRRDYLSATPHISLLFRRIRSTAQLGELRGMGTREHTSGGREQTAILAIEFKKEEGAYRRSRRCVLPGARGELRRRPWWDIGGELPRRGILIRGMTKPPDDLTL